MLRWNTRSLMKVFIFMDKTTAAIEWFEYADRDLDSAIFLQQMKPLPLEIICFHCQQSAEKYLKGYIALNGGEIQRTHDLILLLKICIKYCSEFEQIREECLILTDHAVVVRYPSHSDIVIRDMEQALIAAAKIQKHVKVISNV